MQFDKKIIWQDAIYNKHKNIKFKAHAIGQKNNLAGCNFGDEGLVFLAERLAYNQVRAFVHLF